MEPIVGVLTTPIEDGGECVTVFDDAASTGLGSCFHSLYVSWLESAGARVVPILYDSPESELRYLFESVNGILFTGGDTKITSLSSRYMRAAGSLLNMSIESKDYVPVWGTCMGFQTLSVLIAQDPGVLESGVFDSDPLMLPLNDVSRLDTARLWNGLRDINPNALKWVTTENITVNLHHDGVSPESFVANERLSSFFDVLSTNRDRRGRPFASTIEGKTLPVYGTQYHPERNQFEFRNDPAHRDIPHTLHAVTTMQAFANFFVEESRRNDHAFKNATDESLRLIYNFVPQGAEGDSYRAYMFPPVEN